MPNAVVRRPVVVWTGTQAMCGCGATLPVCRVAEVWLVEHAATWCANDGRRFLVPLMAMRELSAADEESSEGSHV